MTEQYILMGQITSVWGVRGWLKIVSWTEPPQRLLEYPRLFCRAPDGDWQPLQLAEARVRGRVLLARVDGCEDRNAAEQYPGRELGVLSSDAPPLPENEYYWHQLEGAAVWTTVQGREVLLGSVVRLMETGANDVLILRPCAGSCDQKRRLIPWLPERTVLRVELEEGRIWVDWSPDF